MKEDLPIDVVEKKSFFASFDAKNNDTGRLPSVLQTPEAISQIRLWLNP